MSARPKNWPGSTLSWRRLPRAVQRGKRQPFALARRSLPGSGSLRLPPCSSLRHWADAHGQTHTRAAAGSRATGAPAFPRLAAGSGCRCSGYLGDVDCPASRGAACAGHGCVRFRPGPGTSGRALRCPVRHGRVRRPGTGPVGGPGMTSRPPPGCWQTFGPSVSPGRHAPPDGSSPNWRRSACGQCWMRSAWPVPPGSGPGGASSRRSGDSAGCRIRQHGNRPDCCGTLDACNNRHSCKQHHQP